MELKKIEDSLQKGIEEFKKKVLKAIGKKEITKEDYTALNDSVKILTTAMEAVNRLDSKTYIFNILQIFSKNLGRNISPKDKGKIIGLLNKI